MKTKKLQFLGLLLLIASLVCGELLAQDGGKQISGIILDNQNEPIIGASITVKGTTTGTLTDIDGRFKLTVAQESVLSISYIGYIGQEIRVGATNEYSIVMEEDNLDLEEVVVIGYGTARKRDLTGAISSVRTDKLKTEVPRSVQDLLRGNVAGLNVGMSSNAKGSGKIEVRGQGTLSAESNPLIVVDGVIYDGDLSDINPNDIASIDVLKDASSAAVYGAKAASGIVAIVTHRGANTGKPVVNFTANWGMVNIANKRKVLSPEGYIKFRQDYQNGRFGDDYYKTYPEMYSDPRNLQNTSQLDWYNYDMKTPISSVSDKELMDKWLGGRLYFKTPELENYYNGNITDWGDLVFHTGIQQDYSASISNRTDNVNYYWSLGWQDRESLFVGDKYTNFTSRINLESKINKIVSLGVNMNFSSRDESAIMNEWEQYSRLSPYASNDIDNPNSKYRMFPTGDNSSKNPFYDNLYRDREDIKTTLNGTMFAKLNLPYGFEYQLNYTPHLSWREYYNHDSSQHEDWAGSEGKVERTHYKWFNWQVDNVLRWKKEYGSHSIEATFLVNAEKSQSWKTKANSSNFSPNDNLGFHNIGGGSVPQGESDNEYATGDALMGRLFYSYMNKYMLTASVRKDGYSAFGQRNPHATFPAIALGWVFTSETFGEKLNPAMSYGKLRFSWGENGNRDIGQYSALSKLTASLTPFIDPLVGKIYTSSQLWVERMHNPNLKWERTASFNLGLDFSVWKDIISGSIDVYNKRTNDLLVKRRLPRFTGFENIWTNLGCLENKGIEIQLNANIMNVENFNWTASGNFSLNRRKILELYGDMVDVADAAGNVIGQKEADDVLNKWFIGHDPDQIWAYERDGVWKLGEEAEAEKYGCAPGDFKYIDKDGDGIMTDDDKEFQGYKTPRFRWSIRNTFRIYNDFELSFMLYSLWGHYDSFNDAANNVFADRLSNYDNPRWTKDAHNDDYARISSRNIGDNWVSKSFIKLDNITLSYYVPQKMLKKMHLQNLRLTASVKNIVTFAPKWKNWDPEKTYTHINDDGATEDRYGPSGRVFNLGANLTF